MSSIRSNDPSSGYSPSWRDTEDYIEDITYRIWERGDIEFIRDTYSESCPVYTIAGCCFGTDVVVANTKRTLEMFPDRNLYPEDVLWNGDNGNDNDLTPDQNGNVSGYHSSHLISSRMTYSHPDDGESDFSANSTGKRARIWVIAHTIIRNGLIVREWLVRDNQYLYEQMGVDPDDVAKKWARKWYDEIQKTDGSSMPLSHHDWLKSEFDRVTLLTKNMDNVMSVDLKNVFPVDHRKMYNFLGQHIALKYKKLWGKEGMESKEKFSEILRSVYHPHARFESAQAHDVVGYEELEELYDNFVLGNDQGENVAFAVDWIILKPKDGKRQGFKKDSGLNGPETANVWRYPESSDVELGEKFMDWFDHRKAQSAAERFTMAIRWTLVGHQKQNGDKHGKGLPVVLLAESHLECAGFRIIHDITVYDNVAVKAQIELGKLL